MSIQKSIIFVIMVAVLFIAAGDGYVETGQLKVQGDFIRSYWFIMKPSDSWSSLTRA